MSLSEGAAHSKASAAPRPIRVAHFFSSLGIYGAERWTLALLKYLDTADIQSLVITIGTKPGATLFRDFLLKQGVHAEHLSIPGKLSPAAVAALRGLLKREHIDVLHSHGFKSDILGYLACRASSVRIVSTPHGWSASEGWRIRAYESLGRLFLRGFDRIYPLSQALYDDFIARGFSSRKVKLILNGVDIAAFDQCYRNRRVRGPGEPFKVLFAGRLCKPKGVADLIHGFAAAVSVPGYLRILGEGPDRQLLESLACKLGVADRVEFAGAVDSIFPHLDWADVLVLPSYAEGIPRTVMEAFAAGVPVIGSDIPGIRVLINPYRSGILVAPGDAAAIERALSDLASNPDMARQFAVVARDRIDEGFSARRVAADYTAEYRLVAAR